VRRMRRRLTEWIFSFEVSFSPRQSLLLHRKAISCTCAFVKAIIGMYFFDFVPLRGAAIVASVLFAQQIAYLKALYSIDLAHDVAMQRSSIGDLMMRSLTLHE
jgi:hypothetical protein